MSTTMKQPTSHRSENDLNSASNAIDRMISMSTEDPAATTNAPPDKCASDPSASTKASNACPSRFRTIESLKRLKWTNTSPEQLLRAEMRILDTLKSPYQGRSIPVMNKAHSIWTIYSNLSSTNIPLVLVHGFGGGVGLWSLNLDQICIDRPIYAFDLPGFARSSRPILSLNPVEAEQQFVDMFEEWRKEIGLNKPFILLGHSFGGFLSASYAIRYPAYVKQLVLVDPWGFAEKPADVWQSERLQRVPPWLRTISSVVMKFSPLAALRAAGPLGVHMVKRFRPDLRVKFEKLFDDDRISEYLYHCNAQTPTGEEAFRTISDFLAWAKEPMIRRIDALDPRIPIYFLHGEKSWIDCEPSVLIQSKRDNVFVDMIEEAGHHVYADAPEEFDLYLKRILINNQ